MSNPITGRCWPSSRATLLRAGPGARCSSQQHVHGPGRSAAESEDSNSRTIHGMNDDWESFQLCPEPPPEGAQQRAAVLAPLYEDGAEIRMVLIRRPVHMPTHGGDLAFPGGKPEAGEKPLDTALREAHEEVGIEPADVEVLGYLPAIHTVTYPRMVVPVVGRLSGIPALIPDPNEVDRILTPSVSSLRAESRWRVEDWNGRPIHFFDIDDDVLWGATARMVRSLLGLGGY